MLLQDLFITSEFKDNITDSSVWKTGVTGDVYTEVHKKLELNFPIPRWFAE